MPFAKQRAWCANRHLVQAIPNRRRAVLPVSAVINCRIGVAPAGHAKRRFTDLAKTRRSGAMPSNFMGSAGLEFQIRLSNVPKIADNQCTTRQKRELLYSGDYAPLAQLDRASVYGTEG